MKLPPIALFLVASFLTLSATSAAVLVNDSFDIPSGSATPGDDALDSNDIAWTSTQGNFLGVATRTSFGSDALGNTGSSNQFRITQGSWGSTTPLSSIGDTLTYSFKIQTNNSGVLPSQQAGYSGGLFNSSGQGYFFWVGVGGNTNLSLHYDDGTGDMANAYAGSGVSALGSAVSGTSIDDSTVYDATLTLERVASGISIQANFDGTTVSHIDTTSPITSFNQAVNGLGSHSVDWWVDDIVVDFTPIPEPSLLALMLLGLPLLLRHKR